MINLILGDCLKEIKKLPAESVDAVVTDPPYGLQFMGKEWDSFKATRETKSQVVKGLGAGMKFSTPEEMLNLQEFSRQWATECFRVLKPGGYLLSFAGSRTAHRIYCGIEDAGFQIRDCIMWVYGQGFPKSLNIGKVIDRMKGYGTALKPAYEPICIARKPITEKTVVENVLKYGTGALNIDACRIEYNNEIPNIGGRANHTRGDGHGFKALGDKICPNLKGRFPANFCHDGSEEVIKLFPNTTSRKHDGDNEKLDTRNMGWGFKRMAGGFDDSGSAARFFYTAKASRTERELGCEDLLIQSAGEMTGGRAEGSAGLKSPRAGAGRTSGAHNYHPTVKPIKLMEYIIKLVTPPNGVVLDPFMGSGSTGIAAQNLGYNFIGIDKDKGYFTIAEKRLEYWSKNKDITFIKNDIVEKKVVEDPFEDLFE